MARSTAASSQSCNDQSNEMMSGLRVETMLKIFFVPGLYAERLKVQRQPRRSTDAVSIAGEPARA
jgi:hypothetical protein